MPTAIRPATDEMSMAVGTAEVYLNSRPASSDVIEPPARGQIRGRGQDHLVWLDAGFLEARAVGHADVAGRH